MKKITKIKLIKIDIPLGTRIGHIRNNSQPRFNLGQLVRLYKMCLIGQKYFEKFKIHHQQTGPCNAENASQIALRRNSCSKGLVFIFRLKSYFCRYLAGA